MRQDCHRRGQTCSGASSALSEVCRAAAVVRRRREEADRDAQDGNNRQQKGGGLPEPLCTSQGTVKMPCVTSQQEDRPCTHRLTPPICQVAVSEVLMTASHLPTFAFPEVGLPLKSSGVWYAGQLIVLWIGSCCSVVRLLRSCCLFSLQVKTAS